MPQAQTSTSVLAYVPEVTYGVTPASAAFIALDRTDFTLASNADTLTSNTIRADRQTPFARTGNKTVEGDLVVELSPDNYDVFLEAALQGTWATNKLSLGTTQRSFAFEQGFDIGGTKQYRVFNGCVVDALKIDVGTDDLVSATFSFFGSTESPFTTVTADASAGYTAVVPKDVFYHVGGTFMEGGATAGFMTSIGFELKNNVAGTRVLGNAGYGSVTSGKANVTGTVTALFDSIALYNKFVNGTDSSLSFTLAASAKTMKYEFHKVRYTSGKIVTEADAGVTVELEFTAVYDSTATNTMTITRT